MNISQGLWSPFNNKCAKREVTAILIPKDTSIYPPYYIGKNYCNTPQDVCPREEGERHDHCCKNCLDVMGAVGVAEVIIL